MLKKTLSVFLAILMAMSVCTLGFTAAAANIDYNIQYAELADALTNEHVRTLTNYTVENKTLENGAEGFDTDANGFAYEHRITAADDADGSILRAANVFYYIAESLLSTTYGQGYYNPGLLLNHIIENVKPYFEKASGSEYELFTGGSYSPTSEQIEAYNKAVAAIEDAEGTLSAETLGAYGIAFVKTDGRYFEDFYGDRYYPTPDELATYANACSLIEANNEKVSEATLSELRVYFIERDFYTYYNVEAVLKYFMGNTTTINAGNWYHRFVFIVQTSVDTAIQSIGSIGNYSSTELVTRTGVFEWDYARTYNDLKTKAYYAFKKPSASTVWNNYGSEFGLDKTSTDLTETMDGEEGITAAGQAADFLIKEEIDTTTIPYLSLIYNSFSNILVNSDTSTYASWDAKYTGYSDTTIKADSNNAVLAGYVTNIGQEYSNDALLSMFGQEIGNIVTAAYILTPTDSMPTRTIYGKTISVTPATLDEIIYDMDGLITPREDTNNSRDAEVAGKVAQIVKLFFSTDNDLFKDTDVYGLEFSSLHELVGLLVNGLVFRDSIVNMLMKLLYPMVCDLIEDKVLNAISSSAISSLVGNILNSLLTNNDLAIYPNTLASQLKEDLDNHEYSYYSKFYDAVTVLNAAGSSWDNVNWDAMTWGIDDAPLAEKGEVFLEAMTASLSGFLLLLVTFICGSTENDDRTDSLSWTTSNQFTEYYSKLLINVGQNGVLMRSQGLYEKLFIPLYRVLGLTEVKYNSATGKLAGYLSASDFESMVDKQGSNVLIMVLKPIIYWVTDVLGTKPFETLWNVLPNLVYFFTRTSNVTINDDWASVTNDNKAHHDFNTVQTYNLSTILDHVYVKLTLFGNISIYSTSIGAILPDNIKGWLSSINKLLNGVLTLQYNTGVVDHEEVAAYATSDRSEVVLPDSVEYVGNPENYPVELMEYYTDPTGNDIVADQDDDHQTEVKNIVYVMKEYQLPQIQEAKLVSCGTVYQPDTWNTLTIDHPGVVLLYVLRYVCTALGYRYDNTDTELPYLIECFGLNIDNELFQGLNLKDIIYNVMLHPDDAIWSLLELFYSHEDGDYLTNTAYTYDIEEINYHNSTLLNKSINPTLTYGTKVRYTKYWTQEYATDVVSNADEFVKNILIMLGMTDFADGIGAYIQKLLNENVFTDKIVNLLFNLIYQLLGGLNDTVGIDIETILDAALDVTYSTSTIATALYNMCGESEAYDTISASATWNDLFTDGDVTLNWGIDDAAADDKADLFCRTVSALLSPVAFVFRYLLLDEDMDILSLVKLPSYAGYQYAVIGLLEALSCPDILTYKQYADKCDPDKDVNADANTIYYILTPILGLLDELYAAPVDTLLTMLPNLLFVISIGGLNDILNNLVHFAYVLLDILSPIVDVYSLLDGLLANIEIAGVSINLSLPLDIDFNAVASDLISALVGDAIQINGVSISLPYIDFHTLCCGTLSTFASKELRTTVHLDAAGGGDMITALLRLVLDTLFLDENEQAIAELVASAADNGEIDNYDKETIVMIVDELFTLMQTYEVPDMVLFALYFLINKLTPISGTLAPRFQNTGLTIQSLFSTLPDVQAFIADVSLLVGASSTVNDDGTTTDEQTSTITGFGSLLARIKAFFQKILQFFKNMFK